MPNHKKDPSEKKRGICGCVVIRVKELITEEAIRRGESVGVVVGEILNLWAEGKIRDTEINLDQYVMFSQDQEKREPGETTMYQEGALGKENKGRKELKTTST